MDSKTPWWNRYRKRKYKPRNHMTLEMILRKSFVETVKEYIAACSIPGMRQITAPENSILQRLFWLGLLCSFFGIVIHFLQYTWVSTLTKPLVVTGESFTFPIKDIDFPAVAFCNINRISRKALKNLTLELYPKLAKLNTTLTNLETFLRDMGRLIDFAYDEIKSHAKLVEVFALKEYNDRTVEFMKTLAPRCEEMLVKCAWAGQEVDCKSIFRVRRTILGHCCAFNYVLNYDSADNAIIGEEVKSQIVPGPSNGLRVIVDSMVDDYAYPLAHRQGFEILLFDPTHFADMTGGRVLQRTGQPNQAQSFQISSIKQVASAEVRKYPLKTRKCLFRDEYAKEFHKMYSYSACIIKCRIQSIQSLCKCTPFFLPSGISSYKQICTLQNLRCLNKYKEKVQYLYPMDTEDATGLEQEIADSLYCPKCLPDCELTQHFLAKSFKIPLPQGPRKRKGFRNNFIDGVNLSNKCVINIYQPTSEGILHRLDVIAYWFEILSNIGGFSGMLMGLGIFTIVEIIYFMFIRFGQIIYFNYLKYK